MCQWVNTLKCTILQDGDTPLSLAVVQQTMDIIEDLIMHHGMDPNYKNKVSTITVYTVCLFWISFHTLLHTVHFNGSNTDG